MRLFLLVLLLASLVATGLAYMRPAFSDILLLSVPVALASAFLLLGRAPTPPAPTEPPRPEKRLIIDGSNALYWKDNTPRLETLIELLTLLRSKGFKPGVIFDASAGHTLFNRYVDDAPFAEMLGLAREDCFVVPKGTIADEYILNAARKLDARIVTNDRYRDWADRFPEIRKPGHLIRGRYEKGALHLHRLTTAHRAKS